MVATINHTAQPVLPPDGVGEEFLEFAEEVLEVAGEVLAEPGRERDDGTDTGVSSSPWNRPGESQDYFALRLTWRTEFDPADPVRPGC
jgi:hypothetical protein